MEKSRQKEKKRKERMTRKQLRKKRHARSPHNNNSKWKSFQGGELCKERNAGEVKPQQVICGLWWKSFSLENLSRRRPPFSRTPQVGHLTWERNRPASPCTCFTRTGTPLFSWEMVQSSWQTHMGHVDAARTFCHTPGVLTPSNLPAIYFDHHVATDHGQRHLLLLVRTTVN